MNGMTQAETVASLQDQVQSLQRALRQVTERWRERGFRIDELKAENAELRNRANV